MNLSSYDSDNSRSVIIESDVPPQTLTEPCWLGIDEAGRGPVLGPMVYGICYSPLALKDDIKNMGFADSKTLTEEKRDAYFKDINNAKETIGWMIHVLAPNAISNAMLRRNKYNLNALSHDSAIGLIQKVLDHGVNLKEVYVDTVGPPDKYQAKLKALFPSLDITVAKKADALYAIVSAASICAKVARDRTVVNWKFTEDIQVPENGCGSGYPGDEVTKKFLHHSMDSVFGFPHFVRFSWSTASKLLGDKAVEVAWDDDEEEDERNKGMSQISTYFQSKDQCKRHTFFEERHLHTVTHL